MATQAELDKRLPFANVIDPIRSEAGNISAGSGSTNITEGKRLVLAGADGLRIPHSTYSYYCVANPTALDYPDAPIGSTWLQFTITNGVVSGHAKWRRIAKTDPTLPTNNDIIQCCPGDAEELSSEVAQYILDTNKDPANALQVITEPDGTEKLYYNPLVVDTVNGGTYGMTADPSAGGILVGTNVESSNPSDWINTYGGQTSLVETTMGEVQLLSVNNVTGSTNSQETQLVVTPTSAKIITTVNGVSTSGDILTDKSAGVWQTIYVAPNPVTSMDLYNGLILPFTLVDATQYRIIFSAYSGSSATTAQNYGWQLSLYDNTTSTDLGYQFSLSAGITAGIYNFLTDFRYQTRQSVSQAGQSRAMCSVTSPYGVWQRQIANSAGNLGIDIDTLSNTSFMSMGGAPSSLTSLYATGDNLSIRLLLNYLNSAGTPPTDTMQYLLKVEAQFNTPTPTL